MPRFETGGAIEAAQHEIGRHRIVENEAGHLPVFWHEADAGIVRARCLTVRCPDVAPVRLDRTSGERP